ncbi:MAG: DUF5615 family PIN-like protein [Bryobacteraceae bacterium]
MRLLADENFPKPVVDWLRNEGHDVLWARTHCPAWKDTIVLDLGESEGRLVLTLDKDFWQIALQRRIPWRNPALSCSDPIPLRRKISYVSFGRLSNRRRIGPHTSASFSLRGFKWWQREGIDSLLFRIGQIYDLKGQRATRSRNISYAPESDTAQEAKKCLTTPYRRGKASLSSRNTVALRRLTWKQKGLDKLAFTANRHAWESLVPRSFGYFRFPVEPSGQLF